MPRYSILITVLIALVATLSTVSFTVWEFYQLNRQQYLSNIFSKNELVRQIYNDAVNRQSTMPMFEANLALYNLDLVHKYELKKEIMFEGDKVKKRPLKVVVII